jgi:hypothetical protein
MTNTENSQESPEDNLYAAPQLDKQTRIVSPNDPPGPIAVTISVLIAVLVSIPVFAITFFFTCLGLSSIKSLDNEFGFFVLILIASATAIVSIVLVTKGILAIIRLFRNT